jgi:hypothetical protein
MKPKINDTVQLTESLPEENLATGSIGVVVFEFSVPEEAYEIEFSNERGETIAQVALRPNQFVVLS